MFTKLGLCMTVAAFSKFIRAVHAQDGTEEPGEADSARVLLGTVELPIYEASGVGEEVLLSVNLPGLGACARNCGRRHKP